MQTEKDQKYLEKTIQYQELIDELMSDKPNEKKVKKIMQGLDLKYIEDPVERLNVILKSLHS